MSESSALSFRERLFKHVISNPKNYPAWNYQIPVSLKTRLILRGLYFAFARWSPPVAQWEKLFGAPRPNLLILDARRVSGSHFVLHHLQRHPALLCLHETVLFADVRRYFAGDYPIYNLAAGQLVPYKVELSGVKYCVVNKPVMETVYGQYRFHRRAMAVLHLLRNPVAYCLARRMKRQTDGRAVNPDRGNRQNAQEHTDDHALNLIKASIRKSVDFFDPKYDLVFNLEGFAVHPQKSLEILEENLALDHFPVERNLALEKCARCQGKLTTECRPIERRPPERVLVCPRCQAVYVGPGGFNLVREVGPTHFQRWANEPGADQLFFQCVSFFGKEFMDYFRNERYLKEESYDEFSRLFVDLITRLKTK